MENLRKALTIAAAGFILVLGLAPVTASADAVIQFGDTYLGVNDEGHLNVSNPGVTTNSSTTGLTYDNDSDGFGEDATSPGCTCEGWGVAVNGTDSMWINDAFGSSNITAGSFVSTASTATSVVSMTSQPGLDVTHAYAPSAAANVFEATVTITNNTGADVTDARYTRAMDWDIFPDEFNEFVTIGGTGAANLLFSSDDGFANGDPFGARGTDIGGCGFTTDFTDCGPADHGALFDFGFGDLADGESVTFSIFYGAADNETDATAALGVIGAEVFSFGQFSGDPAMGTPATYIFAFAGVGGPPVVTTPEPATLLLMGIGVVGLALRRRKI